MTFPIDVWFSFSVPMTGTKFELGRDHRHRFSLTGILRHHLRETHLRSQGVSALVESSSSAFSDCVILAWESGRFLTSRGNRGSTVKSKLYERAPRQVAYDGAFSSKANLEAIKGKGVEDVAFTNAQGFAVTDMVKR